MIPSAAADVKYKYLGKRFWEILFQKVNLQDFTVDLEHSFNYQRLFAFSTGMVAKKVSFFSNCLSFRSENSKFYWTPYCTTLTYTTEKNTTFPHKTKVTEPFSIAKPQTHFLLKLKRYFPFEKPWKFYRINLKFRNQYLFKIKQRTVLDIETVMKYQKNPVLNIAYKGITKNFPSFDKNTYYQYQFVLARTL